MLQHRGPRTVERPPVERPPAERPPAAGPAERFLTKAAAYRAAGRLDKARRSLESALTAAPDHAGAHYELGLLACRTGGPGQGVPHFVAALRAAPDRPAYWLALANALLEADRVGEARAILERFRAQGLADAATRPVVAALAARAFAGAQDRYDAGDLAAAEARLDLVIALDDTHAAATHLAGAVAARTNRLKLAFDLFSIAIFRDPENAHYFGSLGVLLTMMEDHAGAVSALEKAIALDPNQALAHANLSGTLQKRSAYGAAVHHARRAIALDPDMAGAHVNLGTALRAMGHLGEAIAAYDRAIALDPGHVNAHSNRLFAQLYAAEVPAADYFASARAFGARFADPLLRRRPFANDRDPHRRLRVGFVSGDLCAHAVARFLEPFLEHFDRTRFTALAYMTRASEDAVSKRLRGLFDGWCNVAGFSDDAAADRVEADAVDILIDLSGHSAGHRLLVFARKPAPVQATWMGHPATTGLTAIDYRITDTRHDPDGALDAEALHTEALWRLPGVSATYRPPADIPDVRVTPPFAENGHVTFGSFNRFEKIGRGALETWARILRDLPDARLVLVAGDVEAPEVRAQVERCLSEAGLPLDRVRLQPRVGAGYFELYHGIDIALDPFPYNGGTTTCDTLCMGVPVVALRGAQAVSRTGIAVLTAVGLEDLAAGTPEAYAACAVALARDPERLRALRAGLRERVLASPLTDHARLAAEVGEAFRAMWIRWTDDQRAA